MTRFLLSPIVLLLLGCTHADAASASHKVFTLPLPRAMAANELVRAHITTGQLPRGTRVVAKLPNGEVVGTIAPYGTLNASRGPFTIAIPARGVRDGKVTLHLQVIEKRGAAPRAPTESEIEKIELSLVSAAR